MFIYNFKLNGDKISKTILGILIVMIINILKKIAMKTAFSRKC